MRKSIIPVLLACCMLAAVPRALQAQNNNAFSAKVLFIDYGRVNGLDNLAITNGLELAYQRHFSPYVAFAVPVKVGVVNVQDDINNRNMASIDGLLHLKYDKPGQRIVPYLLAGAGYAWERRGEANLQIPVGLGFNVMVGANSYISLQAEYRYSQLDNRTNAQAGVGYTYRFGRLDRDKDGIVDALDKCPDLAGPKSTDGCPDRDGDGVADMDDRCPDDKGPKSTKGCPDRDRDGVPDIDDECPDVPGKLRGCPDTDGDGVPDKDDQCPNEKGMAELNGCPDRDGDGIPDRFDDCPDQKGPAANKGCPLADRDGDGIPDDMDKCPDQPGSASAMGCPDRDGDGVPDKDDRCPDKPGTFFGCPDTDGDGIMDADDACPDEAGPISNKGCPEIKQEDKEVLNVAMRAVQFETGKATLLASSYEVLNQIVEIMARYPAYNISIAGHTDNVGKAPANLTLSQARARSCAQYLMSRGIAPSRITDTGYGQTQPVADNRTTEGRRLNRRVEFDLFVR